MGIKGEIQTAFCTKKIVHKFDTEWTDFFDILILNI